MKNLISNIKKYMSKKEYIIFLIVLIITLSSLSYAFLISSDMLNNNIATTECFKLTLEDNNDINLDKTYPLSEEEGSNLTPYQFTIKNVCNLTADYQVNLETLLTSTLDTEYLRIKLDNNESSILKRYELNETNINQNVLEGRKITSGTLRANEEKTYYLRIWIDEESTVEQSSNKEYHGKVTVQASPNKDVNDIELAYVVDRVTQDAPPAKGSGYTIKSIDCTNADGIWSIDEWGLMVKNITGKVKCNVEFEHATSVDVTLHGAANAVITYTDLNGNQSQTLDNTGKKENIEIPIMDNLKFTDTTVARDPNNLSNNYTKTISITSETTDVYVMPDKVIYWYGYMGSDFSPKTLRNLVASSPSVTYSTNSIDIYSNETTSGIGQTGLSITDTLDLQAYSNLKCYAKSTRSQNYNLAYIFVTPSQMTSITNANYNTFTVTPAASVWDNTYNRIPPVGALNTQHDVVLSADLTNVSSGNIGIMHEVNGAYTTPFYAIWLE